MAGSSHMATTMLHWPWSMRSIVKGFHTSNREATICTGRLAPTVRRTHHAV